MGGWMKRWKRVSEGRISIGKELLVFLRWSIPLRRSANKVLSRGARVAMGVANCKRRKQRVLNIK